jgi:transposase
MTPEDEIAALKAENARLREQVETLGALAPELPARLANDSHNSANRPAVTDWGARAAACASGVGRSPVDLARSLRARHLSNALRAALVARSEALLAAGLAANPPPQRSVRRWGRIKQSPPRNLVERLWLNQEAVLAFLDDLTSPFDNNQAERDLRMLKVQQTVSGSFCSDAGAAAFACIRGYLSSLRKQGRARLIPDLAGRCDIAAV